jgi:hypothetical protein
MKKGSLKVIAFVWCLVLIPFILALEIPPISKYVKLNTGHGETHTLAYGDHEYITSADQDFVFMGFFAILAATGFTYSELKSIDSDTKRKGEHDG